MQLFEANLVFFRHFCRECGGVGEQNKMAEFWYGLHLSLHVNGTVDCLAKLTLYVHICHVFDGLYASGRVKATLRYRFKTLDRKPRPRT